MHYTPLYGDFKVFQWASPKNRRNTDMYGTISIDEMQEEAMRRLGE